MRENLKTVVAAAVIFLWSGNSLAASCELSDLAGTWIGYSFNSFGYWTRCNVRVDAAGKVLQGSTCSGEDGASGPVAGSWSLISASNCTIKGSLSAGGIRNNISHATLSIDRNSMTGVGRFSNGTFVFNANRL